MSNTNRTNVINRDGSERSESRNSNISSRPQQFEDGSTTIRRTLVERGLRPAGTSGDNYASDGHSSTVAAISTITRQHEDEQRELQELNIKFAVYLDRVQYLEDFNRKLTSDLLNLKQTWGGGAAQLQATHGPQLQDLRQAIDYAIRDQTLQELQLKRSEYDLWHIQQQIATLGDDTGAHRLDQLKQQLDSFEIELEQMKIQYDQRLTDLERLRHLMGNLLNELEGLKSELDNQHLERIMIENEIQTLREHAAFQDAIYQAQRDEIHTLSTPVLDVSGFYRTELARAISDIRQDFEVLSQSQAHELEEYYRIKTEQVREQIESENERKRLLASEGVLESMDTTALSSSIKAHHDDLKSLQTENKQLQGYLDAIVEDLEKIQNEYLHEKQAYDQELIQLRQDIDDKQANIDHILENNISLRFEVSTYGRLLDVEEKHLNRMEQGQHLSRTEQEQHFNRQEQGQRSQYSSSPSNLSGVVTGTPLYSPSKTNLSAGGSGAPLYSPSASNLSSVVTGTPLYSPSSSNLSSVVTGTPLYSNQRSPDPNSGDLATKKMTVQKTARGPISFDSVDLETDSIILVNEKYSGSDQSFRNWTIRRQIDQQPEFVYQFPPSVSLRSRQTVRILSRNSPQPTRPSDDILLADKIDTWGQGHKMVTRLVDDNNEEKAIITQIFQ